MVPPRKGFDGYTGTDDAGLIHWISWGTESAASVNWLKPSGDDIYFLCEDEERPYMRHSRAASDINCIACLYWLWWAP